MRPRRFSKSALEINHLRAPRTLRDNAIATHLNLTDPTLEIRVATFIRCTVDNSQVHFSSGRTAIINTVEIGRLSSISGGNL